MFIPKSLWRQVKMFAVQHDMTMRDVYIDALTCYLKRAA
jgi:hypothetical protein